MLKQFRYTDALIWISFILMLLVKFITVFLVVNISEETNTEITQVSTTYEANPIFRIILNLKMLGFIILNIILPASALAYYYYIRRKVIKGKTELDTLTFFVQFAFFALLINVVNDGAGLLGYLLR